MLDKFISQSFDLSSLKSIDLHKDKASRKSKSIVLSSSALSGQDSISLDVNCWLPAAAEQLNISRDIRDYVLQPAIVNVSGLPNTNGDSFSTQEWLKFRPKFGMQAYRTFKGKPVFREHKNQDHRISQGVIFDSNIARLTKFNGNRTRVMLLLAVDRNLRPDLAQKLLDGNHNTWSMGVYYTSYVCSVCGNSFNGKSRTFCSHTRINRPTYRIKDILAYRRCMDLEGFETSEVADPAFVCAAGGAPIDMRKA